ncbi:MAG: hypothetical protein O7F08_01865 [Deltaproteobacteria bacterium]|nr:hypothetical protein [Deltaproteobacteria bacterium]
MVPQTWSLTDPAEGLSYAMVHEHELDGWVAFVWPRPKLAEDSIEVMASSRDAAMEAAKTVLRKHGVEL